MMQEKQNFEKNLERAIDGAFEQIRRHELAKERIRCLQEGFNINQMPNLLNQEKVKLLHEFFAMLFFESRFAEFKNLSEKPLKFESDERQLVLQYATKVKDYFASGHFEMNQ